MYYIIAVSSSKILDSVPALSQYDLQAEADYFNCAVYAIEGQHSGMTAEPAEPFDDEKEEEP